MCDLDSWGGDASHLLMRLTVNSTVHTWSSLNPPLINALYKYNRADIMQPKRHSEEIKMFHSGQTINYTAQCPNLQPHQLSVNTVLFSWEVWLYKIRLHMHTRLCTPFWLHWESLINVDRYKRWRIQSEVHLSTSQHIGTGLLRSTGDKVCYASNSMRQEEKWSTYTHKCCCFIN